MLLFYFLAALLIQAQAELKCGEEIITEVVEDYELLVGNWTYIFHWDKLEDDKGEKYNVDNSDCAKIFISEASEDDVADKKDICQDDEYDDFDYENVKYKLISPDLDIYSSLIAVGSDKSIMETCGLVADLEIRKVSDDYFLMINYEFGNMVELIGKKEPSREELDCFVDNIDVVKGLDGVAYCFV